MASGKCATCLYPLDGAHKTYCRKCAAAYAKKRRQANPVAHRAYQRQWQNSNPEKVLEYKRKWNRKTTYGLSTEQFEELVIAHDGKCAICKVELTPGKGGSSLCIDHDHETGEVRGLLCSNHNFGIGMFEDDPGMLMAAIQYIHRNTRPNMEVM